MIKKNIIYTSYDDYITRHGRKTLSYLELPDSAVEFVQCNFERMYTNMTNSEKFVKELRLFDDITEQVFFCIKGRMYFLDFFVPSQHIAIEIDGGYHKNRYVKQHDKQRDLDFLSIGIMTIRVRNQDLKNPNIRKIILSKCSQSWKTYKSKMRKTQKLCREKGAIV